MGAVTDDDVSGPYSGLEGLEEAKKLHSSGMDGVELMADVTDDECRVNGYFKDESNSKECKEACISHIPSCTGYAISDKSYNYPNRCYIYGNINEKYIDWEKEWKTSDETNHFVPSMTKTNKHKGLACFRRNVVLD